MVNISIHALPRKNATGMLEWIMELMTFQSTHSLARMRRAGMGFGFRNLYFNPRIPSQECDKTELSQARLILYFNPRIPSQECDAPFFDALSRLGIFQSTHSLARMRPKVV